MSLRPAARAGSVLVFVTALCASTISSAGVVRGQLTIVPDRGDVPSEGLWRIDNGILPVVPRAIDPRTECVLMLQPRGESKAKDARKPSEETITVEVRGLRLQPSVIAVPVGATLEIKNEDRVPHTLYTAAPEETVLPLRPTPAGATRQERMQRAGVFTLLDDELPHVRGWIIVTDGATAMRPDEKGAFRGEVPDGRYTLRLYFRGNIVVERDLDVSGKPLELTFALPSRSTVRKEAAAPETPPMRPLAATPDAGAPPDGGSAH